ncbi:hypothetical protein Nepgr_026542 [Nepenthes gracilis]|uniref:Uncharacterized protein n=1 Tax=Nepenthes gracilis TaxID=150966 RepID=A0AAD3T8L3_NEPGR|nr:hypothetical protein Nepgr_026542 [Nepenthes gracilis]
MDQDPWWFKGCITGHCSDISTPMACNLSTCCSQKTSPRTQSEETACLPYDCLGGDSAVLELERPRMGGTGCTCCGSLVGLIPIWFSPHTTIPPAST